MPPGALREEHVEPRPAGPAGDESLLPLATVQYADAVPTTIEDIETLAPVTKPETKARVEQADPDLDADLAAWFSKECPLPRLTLLGPVDARTRGNAAAAIKRKPYYVELLAFLALRPRGATTDEILEAFSITKNRARVDLTALRSWLGRNPRTGHEHFLTPARPVPLQNAGQPRTRSRTCSATLTSFAACEHGVRPADQSVSTTSP